MSLLNMSIYGAVIIFAILIIRAFTLHKLPKKTFLILWAVALVRLLVPFEIASGFSLYSLLPEAFIIGEQNDVYAPNKENPQKDFENYYTSPEHRQQETIISGEDGGPAYLPTEPANGEIIPLPDVDEVVLPAIGNTLPDQSDFSISLQKLWNNLRPHLPLVWGIGALLCACFFLVSYLRCRLEFSTSLPVTEDYSAKWLAQHPLKRTVSIRQSDKISAPLTYGLFRPIILMPKKTDWSNTEQLDYVLYHEFTHIRRFDLLAKLITIAAVCIHWFNPFVWLLYFFFNRDLELSCDDCVVKHFGETKSAYANTLIGMEEKRNFSTPLCNHFSKNAIEERITAIMKSKKTTIGMMVAAVVIVILVVVTLTTGRKETAETPEDSNADSSVMTEYKEVLTPRIQEYLSMMNSCFLNNPPIAGKATPENAISIAGNTGFYPVDEEVFPSYDALIGYVKDICTEKHADELCRRYWLLDLNVLPNIGVLSGKAYTKQFQSTPYPEHFEVTDIKENIKKYYDTTLSATIRFTEGTNPYYWGILTFAKQEDTWYVAEITLHRHPMDVSPTPTTSPLDRHEELPPWSDEDYNFANDSDSGYENHTPAFPQLEATDVTVTGKDWCLTYIDELTLPRYQELTNAGAVSAVEESDYLNVGHWYTLSLDGISYFFYREDAPTNNDRAFAIAITSPDYPLSGGAKVGMTTEALLTLYPDLAKTELVNEDPAFEVLYGPTMYSFRADQFPPAFLTEYEYAYIAVTEKDYPGLPICVAFLIKDGMVSAITEYMPTAN